MKALQGSVPPSLPHSATGGSRPERRRGDRNHSETTRIAFRRDRLLSALVLIMALALALALPFALQAGSAFFLPLTAALVFGIMLAPLQLWFERHSVPSTIAAALTVTIFLLFVLGIAYAIVMPALAWVNDLPIRVETIKSNIDPIIAMFDSVDQSVDRLSKGLGVETTEEDAPGTLLLAPSSVMEIVTGAAPSAVIQTLFALLTLIFFLATFSGMRERMIRGASTISGGKTAAYLLRDMTDGTGRYIATVALINVALGMVVTAIFYALGMESSWMWGGLAALLNFVPYVGPVVMFALAAIGGLATYFDPLTAMFPALAYLAVNVIEAYIVTPAVLGKRFTINPLAIMIALSFWGWIWGAMGALISVPLLIIGKTLIDRIGGPNITGFLLDHTTLIRDEERKKAPPKPAPADHGQESGTLSAEARPPA